MPCLHIGWIGESFRLHGKGSRNTSCSDPKAADQQRRATDSHIALLRALPPDVGPSIRLTMATRWMGGACTRDITRMMQQYYDAVGSRTPGHRWRKIRLTKHADGRANFSDPIAHATVDGGWKHDRWTTAIADARRQCCDAALMLRWDAILLNPVDLAMQIAARARSLHQHPYRVVVDFPWLGRTTTAGLSSYESWETANTTREPGWQTADEGSMWRKAKELIMGPESGTARRTERLACNDRRRALHLDRLPYADRSSVRPCWFNTICHPIRLLDARTPMIGDNMAWIPRRLFLMALTYPIRHAIAPCWVANHAEIDFFQRMPADTATTECSNSLYALAGRRASRFGCGDPATQHGAIVSNLKNVIRFCRDAPGPFSATNAESDACCGGESGNVGAKEWHDYVYELDDGDRPRGACPIVPSDVPLDCPTPLSSHDQWGMARERLGLHSHGLV